MKEMNLKVVINKKNNQFTLPLPKKKLTKETIKDIQDKKKIRIRI